MGFGHRVYKNYDPRAKIMQKTTHEVLDELGIKDDPLLDVAMELERIALHDEYFIEKKLYPNIDFYSGITLKAMGFPTSMFTVLFALARTVGWIAQWKEMIEDPSQKIGRPRQLYTGAPKREYCRSTSAELIDLNVAKGPHWAPFACAPCPRCHAPCDEFGLPRCVPHRFEPHVSMSMPVLDRSAFGLIPASLCRIRRPRAAAGDPLPSWPWPERNGRVTD